MRKNDNGYNDIIKDAIARGWEPVRQNKHLVLKWPPTNRRTAVSCSSSEWRAVKNLQAKLRRMEAGALQ
jgi:hypothetical protein